MKKWKITVTTTEPNPKKRKELFSCIYDSKKEAEAARMALIRIAADKWVIAPCDENTGKTEKMITKQLWSIGQVNILY